MNKPLKIRQKEQTPTPAVPRQMRIAFDSNGLRGLSAGERRKALTDLTHLLMLAAGVVAEEGGDER